MPHNKTRILFIIPALGRGGAETQVVDLINHLDHDRFDIRLVAFNPYLDQLDRLNIDSDKFFHLLRKKKLDFSVISKIARLIDEHEIDVVHCTMQFALLMGWLALRRSQRKPQLMAAIHTTKNVMLKTELLDRFVYRWILRDCCKVVFVCHTQADYWASKFPELKDKSDVVYNGVDARKYSVDAVAGRDLELRQKLGISETAPILSCIAGFRREKGHALLIDAFHQADLPDAVLVLAGDGLLRPQLEQQVADLELESRVVLAGKMSDVRPLLSASRLSILASTAVETFSIAMLESMAMQVPVLATNIGGLREAITPGETGDLLEPGNVEEMSEKVRSLMSDAAKCEQMGTNARALVIEKFRNEEMAAQMERLFNDAIAMKCRNSTN